MCVESSAEALMQDTQNNAEWIRGVTDEQCSRCGRKTHTHDIHSHSLGVIAALNTSETKFLVVR